MLARVCYSAYRLYRDRGDKEKKKEKVRLAAYHGAHAWWILCVVFIFTFTFNVQAECKEIL